MCICGVWLFLRFSSDFCAVLPSVKVGSRHSLITRFDSVSGTVRPLDLRSSFGSVPVTEGGERKDTTNPTLHSIHFRDPYRGGRGIQKLDKTNLENINAFRKLVQKSHKTQSVIFYCDLLRRSVWCPFISLSCTPVPVFIFLLFQPEQNG